MRRRPLFFEFDLFDEGITGGSDLTFNLLGGNVQILNTSDLTTPLDSNALAGLTSIRINGVDTVNDILRVDLTGFTIDADFPLIEFAGGDAGMDSLFINGGIIITSDVTHTLMSPTDGMVSIDSFNVITYTAWMAIPSPTISLLPPGSSRSTRVEWNIITLLNDDSSAVAPDPGGAMRSRITLGDSGNPDQTLNFTNPTTSLEVNAGVGEDTINLVAFDMDFAATVMINGDAENDTITLDAGAVPAGAGAFTLNGLDGNDILTINSDLPVGSAVNGGIGDDDFNVNVSVTSNFNGEAGVDDFVLADGVTVTGAVDGGAGSDTLDFSAFTTTRNVILTNTGATDGFDGTEAAITGGFDNIETVLGGTATDDSITGIDDAATWDIAGTNTYTSTNTLAFSGIEVPHWHREIT